MAMRIGFDVGSDTVKAVVIDETGSIEPLGITPIKGQPILRVKEMLERILGDAARRVPSAASPARARPRLRN